MYSTSELDELFQILNSIKGFKLDNHKGATQQYLKIAYFALSYMASCLPEVRLVSCLDIRPEFKI